MSIKLGSGGIVIPYSQAYVGNNLVFTKDVGDALLTESNRPITTENGEYIDYESVPYTMLDWIENTGTQWIDTGILNSATIKVETKMAVQGNDCLCGSEYTWQYRYKWGTSGSGLISYSFGNNNYYDSTLPHKLTDVYTYYMARGEQWVKNVSGTKVISSADTTLSTYSQQPIALFGSYSSGTLQTAPLMRIYYCKIYDGDTLVRDFIPVLDENNVACLYDKVTETYFYNQGTGNFIPSETSQYKVLNYLESSGTQIINTGFKHNQNTRVVGEIEIFDNLTYRYYLGSFGGTSGTNRFFSIYSSGSNILSVAYGSGAWNSGLNMVNRFVFDLNKNVAKINSATNTFSSQTFQSTYDFCLFGSTNYNGGYTYAPNKVRYYNNTKIYDNGNLVRDLMPIIRKSDNVPCLYDLVSNTFYTNAGTGTFLYG